MRANFGVGAELLAFDECEAGMPQVREVLQGQFCRKSVVEDDIGDAFDFAMAGNSDDGHAQTCRTSGVHSDQAFDRALLEQARIFLDELGTVAMANDQIKIALFEKMIFDAG